MTVVWYCSASLNLYQQFIDNDGSEQVASVNDCTCMMYEYNGSCRHIAALRERVCMWRSDDPDVPQIDPDHPSQCPVCGKSLYIMVKNPELVWPEPEDKE